LIVVVEEGQKPRLL